MTQEDKRRYWQNHIEVQNESGLTQKAYCTQHQLKKGTFGYWKTQLSPKASSSRLLPMNVHRGHPISISVSGDARIDARLETVTQLQPSSLASVENGNGVGSKR